MAAEVSGSNLVEVVALLTAGVVAVPIFRRMGLGSILGYLAAGSASPGLIEFPKASASSPSPNRSSMSPSSAS